MPDVTYEYNAWSSNNGWSNPDYAVDGQQGNEAVATVISGPGSSGKLRLSGTDAPGTDLGTITKVEFGAYAVVDWPANQLVAQFVGGGLFGLPGVNSPPTEWVDVSEELGGEDISDWTWDDVQNLDVDMWLFSQVAWQTYLNVDQAYIRVTYDEPSGPANVAKVGPVDSANISKVDGIDWTNISSIS